MNTGEDTTATVPDAPDAIPPQEVLPDPATGQQAPKPLHLETISIKNFRLLRDVTLCLEKRTTVIVGRNNSGKTSLTELFRRLLDKSPSFRLEDFSLGVHDHFWNAFVLSSQGAEIDAVRNALPVIEIKLRLCYDKSATALGPLSDFIIDLNPDCAEALIVIRYQLQEGKLDNLFADLTLDDQVPEAAQKPAFCRAIKERVQSCYRTVLFAVDPNDASNHKMLEWSALHGLLHSGFINAQRALDDATNRDKDVLGKILEALFTTANSESSGENERNAVQALDVAVQNIQQQLDTDFNENLKVLIPAFSLFGYPGLNDPDLRTETTLDVQRLLSNHTKVRYAGIHGVSLPEAYNGLGARNLIFILLQLLEFFRAFKAKAAAPGVHLVFIEEPEAHLHPQMAEVFIRKLEEIALIFANQYNEGVPWPVQFVVTTHSTHMANQARFEAMRYFLATPQNQTEHFRATRIKDLRTGLSDTPEKDREFLHQYMTLTRCDLLFADKAALIEGCTERLLLPTMIEKVDAASVEGPKLSSQYVSVVEVGGAYAHIFFKLLKFLELRTLVITDLDSAYKNANNRLETCKVADGTHTTNACIKQWFAGSNPSPADLIGKSTGDKTEGIICLAYEVPEEAGGPCGRSFEDAFILANPTLFGLAETPPLERANAAWDLAQEEKKTEFALRHAIEVTNWNVPRYIAEGLRWLAESPKEVEDPIGDPLPVTDAQPIPEATNA